MNATISAFTYSLSRSLIRNKTMNHHKLQKKINLLSTFNSQPYQYPWLNASALPKYEHQLPATNIIVWLCKMVHAHFLPYTLPRNYSNSNVEQNFYQKSRESVWEIIDFYTITNSAIAKVTCRFSVISVTNPENSEITFISGKERRDRRSRKTFN